MKSRTSLNQSLKSQQNRQLNHSNKLIKLVKLIRTPKNRLTIVQMIVEEAGPISTEHQLTKVIREAQEMIIRRSQKPINSQLAQTPMLPLIKAPQTPVKKGRNPPLTIKVAPVAPLLQLTNQQILPLTTIKLKLLMSQNLHQNLHQNPYRLQ